MKKLVGILVSVVILVVGSFFLGVYAKAQHNRATQIKGLMGVIETIDYSTNIFVVRLTRIPRATKFHFKVLDPQDTDKFRPKEWVSFRLRHSKSKIKKVDLEVVKIVWIP